MSKIETTADHPNQIDLTLRQIATADALKLAKKVGGYGKTIARMLGEPTTSH